MKMKRLILHTSMLPPKSTACATFNSHLTTTHSIATMSLPPLAQCVDLKPDWAKGYSRLGAAYYGLQEWEEAIKAYEDGEQQQQQQRRCLESG
jgi:hypothetical protein